MANFGRGFAQGLSTGYDIGRTMRKDREEEALKADLANSQTNQVTEAVSGQDTYNAARDAMLEAQRLGLDTTGYQQTIDAAAAQAARPAGLVVGNQSFTDRGDAQRYADTQNAIAAADTYTKHGKTREALDTRLGALQMEKGGYEMKSLKRRDKQETDKAALDDFIRNSAGMDDDQFLSGIAALASNGKQDNLGFTYSRDPRDGQVYLVQHDRNTRQEMRRIPWDGNRDALLQHTMKYFDAASFDAARKEGKADKRYDKEFGLKESELGLKRDTLTETSRHNKAVEGIYRDRAGAAGGGKHDWAPVGEDSDGTPVFLDRKQFDPSKPGVGLVRPDGQPVQDLRGIYRKFTGAQAPKGAPLLKVKVPSADGKGEVEMQVTQDEAVKMGIIPAPAGTFALRDPAALPSSPAMQYQGLSETALDLAASSGDRGARQELQRRRQAQLEEDALSRRGLR